MNNRMISLKENGLHWLDITNPESTELIKIGKKYGLPKRAIDDCLDPEHLPKIERIKELTFIVMRYYDATCAHDADSVQELTRKIAIFLGPDFLLTVHRRDQPFIAQLREKWAEAKDATDEVLQKIVNDLLLEVVATYEKPIEDATNLVEDLETKVFKDGNTKFIIEDGYYLKRKASVIKRMLRLTLDVTAKLVARSELFSSTFQQLKNLTDSTFFFADELQENVTGLLNLQITLASNRTNEASHKTSEVMRILTVFSVFFLPLNFIAGIYGMNFAWMPELQWVYGYPMVLGGMLLVSGAIVYWFWRRGWLS
ncbi:MAG: CorA family divalent cation transporter [Bdellovibrionales bacterium]